MARWMMVVVMMWLAGPGQAVAEARVALIIGNGDYAHVGPLPNPGADAQLMADTLGGLGFQVTLLRDGG